MKVFLLSIPPLGWNLFENRSEGALTNCCVPAMIDILPVWHLTNGIKLTSHSAEEKESMGLSKVTSTIDSFHLIFKVLPSCLRFFKEDFFYTNYTPWRYHWHRPFGFLWSEPHFNERNSSLIGSWWEFYEMFQYSVRHEKVEGTGIDVNYMQIQANNFV